MTITIIAPPQADAAAPAPGNRPGVAHIDPNMKLVTGTFCSASEDWFEEPLERGLRLILVQSGQLRCRIPGQPEHLIEGPSLCTIANDGDFTSAQIYGTDKPLRYTIVQLGVEALDSRLGWLPEQLIRRPGGDPRIMSCPAPRAMQALASQIATCQMLGPTRDLYLGGKALELAALSAQFLSGEGRPVEEPRITCSEVERIHAARDLLVGALQEPPSLDTLASRVGMNPRKLTAGFRKVFGASVFGYLQEYRLREAHRMLCDEEANVSTVAYRVGYSPAQLASQIATCQMLGPTRDLYLGGKALELAALSAQFLSGEGRPVEEPRITCSEVERIHAARDLLVGALQEPPSLDTLASRVGMNPRKLTAGFRKVFGASVFGYLQEYRLREAHRMLCDEEANVSTVAYRVGYSPAHFSIAFRKRYGISPSEIR